MQPPLYEQMQARGYFRIGEAAKLTGLPSWQIYRFVKREQITWARVGGDSTRTRSRAPGRQRGTIYVKLDDLQALIPQGVQR